MNMETNVSNLRFYKILKIKAYFDRGMSILNYLTKALIVLGIGAAVQNYSITIIFYLSVLYGFLALFVGWAWFKFNLVDTENEIQNQFNPFCKDMRKKIK